MEYNIVVLLTCLLLGNNPPTVTADDIFNVIVGKENNYTFMVADSDDNYTVGTDGELPDGGHLVDHGGGMYTFQWTVSSTPTSGVSFRAEDARGAAVLLRPILHLCTCFNGGECTVDGVASSDDLVINLTCVCTEGYF